jgi:hypothetical protein
MSDVLELAAWLVAGLLLGIVAARAYWESRL